MVMLIFKRTNQSCSSSIISQSINVGWRTCDSKKNLSFEKARNALIEKAEIFSLDLAKYLSYSEVQKNSKVVMFTLDFTKKRVCPKSVTKTLYWSKFLVS